jgi:RNA polymerase sigma-70 factor (ECF subfamily)
MTSPSGDQQDREDMARLAAGHDAALDALIERHGQHLFNFLLRHLQNDADASDLAQETFVRIYQHRERFRLDQKFSTWMFTIAGNLLKDRFRWQKRHPQVSLDSQTDEGACGLDTLIEARAQPDERLASDERAAEVRAAIASLPEELRATLILSEYEDLPHAEIGAILNCTPKAVETRLYRARAHLRKRLEKLLPRD